MKHISTILVLLMIGGMIAIDLYSEAKNQNILNIEVNPKDASTIFIETYDQLNVETWNKEFILFQIFATSFLEGSELFNILENNKENMIEQEFSSDDFLFLNIPDLNSILNVNDSNAGKILSYKITVPNHLDIKLWCKNDMSDYVDFQENPKD